MMPPEPLLEFDRFTVRRGHAGDAAQIVDYYSRNRDHLAATSARRPDTFYTEEYWQTALNNADAGFKADRLMHCFVFLESRVVGTVNLSNFVRGAFHACHLGYSLDAGYEGRGVMTKAVGLVVEHAFSALGMHRVMASYMPENARSARLLDRLQFEKEGFARKYLLIDGEWRDHVLTARLNESWVLPDFASADTHVSVPSSSGSIQRRRSASAQAGALFGPKSL